MEEQFNFSRINPVGVVTTCSVSNCTNVADYVVMLYDYYREYNETFYNQDYTCPFICSKHMEANERGAKGERRPRAYVYYPHTNKHGAQGYTKYEPLANTRPELFLEPNVENNVQLQIDLNEINSELIKYLALHPEYLRHLHPRKFEELIADILNNQGYDATLTPRTRDGGKDIIAVHKSIIGHQMLIVECKRYSEENKVGVEVVRGLYGVQQAERYNQAIIATTSTFSKQAIDFVKPLNFQLALKDYDSIIEWCKAYKY